MQMLVSNIKVPKVIWILGTMVIAVIGMAYVINTVFPNFVVQVFSTVEDMIYRGTGFKFDINNDNRKGGDTKGMDYSDIKGSEGKFEDEKGNGVEGWGEN